YKQNSSLFIFELVRLNSSGSGVEIGISWKICRFLGINVYKHHIHDIIKEGDTLEIMPPMGDFVYDFSKEVKTAYLWGVGSGITPLFSLIKSMLILDNKLRVILVYGNRHLESTIFLKEIQALVSKYNDRFKVIEFHTKFSINVNNPSYIQGRIDYKTALSIVNSDNTLESSVHYICGPVGLKESVKNALADRNVHTSQILSEDFELQKNPKDFEHIRTRTVVVNFNGHNHMLEIIKGKSILEAALDANIDLPYSCQTGNCSTCKGVAISGLSQMIGLSKLRDDLESNEFLLCCTHPLTDNVVFKI
ncbi:MAG: iron-sulfur cluster-binding domain-containing protein, partial [Flavobacterium sp.]